MWASDANVFFGYNDQRRKFTDFSAWESQNWFMLSGDHAVPIGRLTVVGMLSLEPFTLKAIGSPQVFQTGEMYRGAPLIDYQHPHDLLMHLGATYQIEHRALTASLGADLVGSPALGPTAYMHRESARDNPQAPLTHHNMDSTHISYGVLRAGAAVHGLTVEGSIFNGREPDENRKNIDPIRLDSWSARVGWRRGPLAAQFSGGRLHDPEPFEPYPVVRLTASIEFIGRLASRPFAATAAWGENREIHGNLDGYLLEWDWRATPTDAVYGRGELAAKDILNLGTPPPPGFIEFHEISHVDALTLGYVRDLSSGRRGRIGIGADATVYRLSQDLLDSYGSPHSFHVFVRWRPNVMSSTMHMH